jgi:protein subunit release factor A
MSTNIRFPDITAKDEAGQLQQVKSYLYQLVNQLNFALSAIESGSESSKIPANAASATAKKEDPVDSFNQIKSLIIKSADIINVYSEEISKKLKGMYVSQSDFGTYSEQTTSNITANSMSITQAYENIQKITSDVESIANRLIEVNAHIKSGLLYYAGEDDTEHSIEIPNGTPVYGLEVGQRVVANGVETFNKYARFTANKLSFYDQNDNEVAYISDYKLYITYVEVIGSFKHGGFVDTTLADKSVVTKWIGGG